MSTTVIADVEIEFAYSLTEYANTTAYVDTCIISVDEITAATADFTTISASIESPQLSNINDYLDNDFLRDISTDNSFRNGKSSKFPVTG